METNNIALFKGNQIRRVIYNNEWWFVVEDVVFALTDAADVKDYINKMRLRDKELSKGYGQIVHTLPIQTVGGKQLMNCANTEGVFRIIQSIPSPKAEPFKRWLAKVGYERVQEIENPELGARRTRMLYKLKGYPDSWIELRMRGIEVREDLTGEWQKRGAKVKRDYEILTAEIAKATFDLTPSQHKKLKGLKRENLRDHMGNLELIFNMLGEASTTEIHKNEDSQGVPKLKTDANRGGRVAGNARKELEKELGRPVVSKQNFLPKKKEKSKNK
jgi:hypothetical protein